jgi:UDP-N-acetylmuramyl tripeptide synthase
MISTLDFAQNVYYSMLTTPSQDLFIDYLIKANEEKLDYLIMEVSSIGIAEFRVNGIIFDYGILTFLEVDHLSYHQSILSYHLSKISFLERCKKVFNGLNESYISFFKRICLEFTDNTSFIDQYLKNLPLVPGREEIISTHPLIIIDYAHTISSMEYVLKKYAAIKKGKLIVVFGSGGKRDMNKRKIYGTLGLTYADINIVTSDNPRDENVNKIIRQICARRKGFIKIKLRDKAIKYALNLASAHDTILLLGKGHEKYQEIKGQRFYFNEEEIAKRFLKEKVN